MRTLLHGRGGPYRDIVTMNAGAALVISGKAADLRSGTEMALGAVMAGKAAKVLTALCSISHGKAA
jgi:anthranilate phosphoribosyltransferase